jgi:hypothetical protein
MIAITLTYGLIFILVCCLVEAARKAILRVTIMHGWRKGKERERRLNERN